MLCWLCDHNRREAKQTERSLKGKGDGARRGMVVLLQRLWEWQGLVQREGQAPRPTKSEWDSVENLIDGADGEQSPP